MGSTYHGNFTDAQESVIRSKFAPGAVLVIAICESGVNSSSMQKIADKLGYPACRNHWNELYW
jgi:hypothetical protein